jgi:hypothetical protein
MLAFLQPNDSLQRELRLRDARDAVVHFTATHAAGAWSARSEEGARVDGDGAHRGENADGDAACATAAATAIAAVAAVATKAGLISAISAETSGLSYLPGSASAALSAGSRMNSRCRDPQC